MNKLFTLLCASLLYAQMTLPGGNPFDVLQKMADQAGKTELKFTRGMSRETLNSQFKLLALYYHPDRPTGSTDLMKQLNDANEKALATLKPEPAPKRTLTKREQDAIALLGAAQEAADAASAAIAINDFATAESKYKETALKFDEVVKMGAIKYKDCPGFMAEMVAAVAELPDIQKKLSVITDDLENGKITPSADVVGKSYMAPFKKNSNSDKANSSLLALLEQLEDRKKRLTLEIPKVFTYSHFYFNITAFDKLIDVLRLLVFTIANEKEAEGFLHQDRRAKAKELFLTAKGRYEKLRLIHCAHRMDEKVAYIEALEAEDTAMRFICSHRVDVKDDLWLSTVNVPAAAWKKAAEATDDLRLKFAYEQRALDIVDPKLRVQFVDGKYKMKEPPAASK